MTPISLTYIFSIVLCLLVHSTYATNYYLSSDGDDANVGTSPSAPWKTIDRINAAPYQFSGGDSMLFRRGDTFRGQLNLAANGSEGNPLVIGAYGSGEAPIISGAIQATNWTQDGENLWYTSVSSRVHHVFVGGQLMTLARYPNDGFLAIDGVLGSNAFQDQALSQPVGYWEGANVHVKTTDYTWEVSAVSDHRNGQEIVLATNKNMTAGWGYYFDNKLEILDTAGEWYYESSSNRLYLSPPDGQNPNEAIIELSMFEYGIKGDWNRENIDVLGLHFQYQALDGVWMMGWPCKNNRVLNCTFSNIGETGVTLMGSNLEVSGSTFEECLGRGIFGYEVTQGTFRSNTIKHTGMAAGYGIDGIGGMIGIFIDRGNDVRISKNLIDTVGYNGITCNVPNSLIERNIVKAPLQLLSDGAGIYCFGASVTNLIIKNNFVHAPFGNMEATFGHDKICHGIYLDNDVSNVLVDSNTVINSQGSGILINADAHDNTITNNWIYNSVRASMEIAEWGSPGVTRNNVVNNNVFCSLSDSSYCVSLRTSYDTHDELASFNGNTYHSPYTPYLIERGSFYQTPSFSFDQWKEAVPANNGESRQTPFEWDVYAVENRVSANLIPNGSFDTDASGWTAWPGGSNSTGYWVADAGLNGGAYFFEMLAGWPENNGYPISSDIPGGLKADKFYELSFSLKSPEQGNVSVIPRRNATPYNNLADEMPAPLGNTWTEHQTVFQPQVDEAKARLDFKIAYDNGRRFYLDEVELYEVEVSYEEPQSKTIIFTNETEQNRKIDLNQTYHDLNGQAVSGSVTLPPFSSRVLISQADPANPFPVELLDFEGKVEEGVVMLDWRTSWELNNDYFTLERSEDGTFYEVLAYIPTCGLEGGGCRYHHVDPKPLNDKAYYRLKQTDLDGSFSYVGVIEVYQGRPGAPDISVFPNPITDGNLNVSIRNVPDELVSYAYLMNNNGQVVYPIQDLEPDFQLRLPGSLSSGRYWLVVGTLKGVHSASFFIQ